MPTNAASRLNKVPLTLHPTEYPAEKLDTTDAGAQTQTQVPDTMTAQIEPRTIKSYSDAIDAIRHDDFGAAIDYLETFVIERPRYHIGWLKLGMARREKAVRLPDDQRNETTSHLRKSIEELTKATEHIDPEYKAAALYERSKAYFQLSRRTSDTADLTQAREDAASAAKISSSERYFTWVDYLERFQQDGQGGPVVV